MIKNRQRKSTIGTFTEKKAMTLTFELKRLAYSP